MMSGERMRAIWIFFLAILLTASGCSRAGDSGRDLRMSFYKVPNPLPEGRPGQMIRMARVPSPSGARAWVVLYHSRSAKGLDIAVSGFLVVPTAPPPASGYPVVSWAHGTTGLADACAPSRTAVSGSLADDWIVQTLVNNGFVVVATDYEGLGVHGPHPYLVGVSEGRSILDAARAARAAPGIAMSNRIALFGYSQGGHGVLWAGQLAGTYAPDLEVAAVVASAPVGDLVGVGNHWAVTDGEQPYLLTALDSWSRIYGLPLDPMLTPSGAEARAQIRHRCTGQLDWEAFGSGLFREGSPAWSRWLDLARLNTPGTTAQAAPVLVQHGDADTLVPIGTAQALVRSLCAHGTQAVLHVYPGAGHDVLGPGLADAISWMRETLSGAPRMGSCDA
jgi:acetyl esterase/lipase